MSEKPPMPTSIEKDPPYEWELEPEQIERLRATIDGLEGKTVVLRES